MPRPPPALVPRATGITPEAPSGPARLTSAGSRLHLDGSGGDIKPRKPPTVITFIVIDETGVCSEVGRLVDV